MVVVDKSSGGFRELKRFGVARSDEEKVYKELERIVRLHGIGLSVNKVLEIARTIITLRVNLPNSVNPDDHYTKTLFLTDKHRLIQQLFECEI